MRKTLFIALIFLTGCVKGIQYDCVEQDYTDDKDKILCGSNLCIVTYVWKDSNIIQSWYDHPDSIKSIRKHKIKGEKLLKLIDSLQSN